jgi:hopene-associated glycosyltransferase HpnB
LKGWSFGAGAKDFSQRMSEIVTVTIAVVVCAIWAYLLGLRGAFWLGSQRDDDRPARPAAWPSVAVVIPARNEADCIDKTIGSLLRQDYPGEWSVILVDDSSTDATATVAAAAAAARGQAGRLTVVAGKTLPAGWTGKLWALQQGIALAEAMPRGPDYLLLTDADIVYGPGVLENLAARAEGAGFVLTSLMVKLRCESLAERFHIPAFIFFFQMLYPFSWVNRAERAEAAAAGGCMLVRADALRQAGGIEAIRTALIDDCALAAKLKAHGPIWLGLTDRVRSIRPYPAFDDIRRMVSRSAYAQLRYSPLLLAGTTLGLALTYFVPPLLALFGSGIARLLGVAAWGMMAVAFQPTLRFYRLSPLWGLGLPIIAFLYLLYTLDSAYQYMRGRGGSWKGRAQANLSGQ